MPVVQVTVLAGRDAETKRRLIAGVTDAVTDALAVEAARVRVLLYEVPPENWGVGGAPKAGP